MLHFLWTQTIPQKIHHVFLVQWRNSPVRWHSLFQLHPLKLHKFSFLSLDLALCFYEFSHFFSLSRSPFQNIRKFLASFTPSSNGLNISAKHTMYFNLLLIISAADKKINSKNNNKKQIHIFQLKFSCLFC